MSLLWRLGAACSWHYYDTEENRGRDVAVFVDPVWSRIILAVEGDQVHASSGWGTGDGWMRSPQHVEISASGQVFVSDTGNDRVQIWTYIPHAGPPLPERTLQYRCAVAGGADFGAPRMVRWDDGGTLGVGSDDYFWVLDGGGQKVVGYKLIVSGSTVSAVRYVALNISQLAPSSGGLDVTCMAVARACTGPSVAGSYAKGTLILYDAWSNRFISITVPRRSEPISDGEVAGITSTQITANPSPPDRYNYLESDPWGNLFCLSGANAGVVKLSPAFVILDRYGSPGTGPLGSGEMLNSVGIAFQVNKTSTTTAEYTRNIILAEEWGADSGVQALKAGCDVKSVTVASNGSGGATVSCLVTDNALLSIRITSAASGATVRTMPNVDVEAGNYSTVWDGRNDAGVPVAPCTVLNVEIKAKSWYSPTDSVVAVTTLVHKPALVANLRIDGAATGGAFTVNGTTYSVDAGAHVDIPCALCETKTVSVGPTQALRDQRYCFDRWSNGGSRLQAVRMLRDSSLTLWLVHSGSGPDTIPAGGTFVNEVYDCKSPYIFQGNGSLTKSADWDSFRTQGPVVFRFPHATGSQTRARLGIAIPAVLRRATFETVDSSSTQGSNLWEGISLTSGGSLDCDSCRITNANVGISAPLTSPARSLRLRNSYLDYNFTNDINVAVDTVGARPVSIYKNRFNGANAVKLTVAGSVIAPHASAVIDSNAFASPAGPSGALNVVGAWSGYISRNQFYIPDHNTVGVQLDRYSNFGWPVFELHQNQFIMEGNYGRFALVAPKSDPFTMNAESNDWGGAYNVAFNDLVIKDYNDDAQRALVDYDPFIIPAGGGGGGCPFVLSQGETGYEVENSILGRSESASAAGATVRDAVVLSHVKWTKEPIRLRIAELESDVDEIDYGALGVVAVGEGEEVGVDTEGLPVVFRRGTAAVNPTRWSGRSQPFVSPIAPVNAYRGEPGDSLELRLDPAPGAVVVRDTRIAVSMVPKPQAAPSKRGGLAGVTVRVSYDSDGEKWTSIPAVFPREAWTTQVLPLGEADARIPSRVRIVWNSRHTLGWVGLVESRPAELLHVSAPRMARHSSGHDVLGGLSREDGQSVRILPGEHLDLEFASPERDPNARLVLLVRGRYTRTGTGTPGVPAVAYLAQNRPNPFNPETEIRFGLPAAARTSLRVFSVSGRLMATLVDGVLPGGTHIVRWDGRDSRGLQVSSGVYFYQIDAGDFHERRRMVLLR